MPIITSGTFDGNLMPVAPRALYKWWYSVECTRKVSIGTTGWMYEQHIVCFPFGKNQPYRTGTSAYDAAHRYALSMMDCATRILIWRMNASGSGVGATILAGDRIFDTSFDGTTPDPVPF